MNLLGRFRGRQPKQSIIVIAYNMRRAMRRTLLSLSASYQQGIGPEDYEVLVVDNGSTEPLDERSVTAFGPQFRYLYFATESPSPVAAINHAVQQSRGEQLGVFIDGARILTPGILRLAAVAARGFEEPVVATLNWLLGSKPQHLAVLDGYCAEVEERLIADAGWPARPYALHRVSVLGGSSDTGYFRSLAESNGLFVSRRLFERLGGYDARFVSPGGGLVNLDFYRRACEAEGTELVVLLGEGTFHQIHGGVMTNSPALEKVERWKRFEAEYREITGRAFARPDVPAVYLGSVPDDAASALRESVDLLEAALAASERSG